MPGTEKRRLFVVSPGPHLHQGESVPRVMWTVVAALLPALACGFFFFGLRAFLITSVSVITAVATEALIQKLRRRPITIYDGSAVCTGILLAFCLSPRVPLWLPAVGAFFGIAVAKQAFGGLGYNVFNPALAGRAFVMHSWLTTMTSWEPTAWQGGAIDAATYATPLGAAKEAVLQWIPGAPGAPDWLDLFIGNTGGSIGETSALAIMLGGAFLLIRRYIGWETPVAFIGTVALLVWVLPAHPNSAQLSPLCHIFSGGLFLGAFFMATDMVTTPITPVGKLWFGFGCGVLTAVIRLYGGFPEGVCYSILIMNAVTPLIDRLTRPRIFGTGGRRTAG